MPQASTRRIVIHSGFHKTGTSTVQQVLKKARHAVLPHLRILLKSDIAGLCMAARGYAATPTPARLASFADHAAASFDALDADDPRPIVISAEDLCGRIPGRNGRIGYPHAPVLLDTLLAALPPRMAPHVFLSTREKTSWMRSCYAHHLRHTQMRLDWDSYRASQGDTRPLTGIADEIANVLGDIPLSTMPIETMADLPQGPLTPLLDLLDLPLTARKSLTPTQVYNTSMPPDILAQFLLLNRTTPDADTRNAAKQALIAATKKATP